MLKAHFWPKMATRQKFELKKASYFDSLVRVILFPVIKISNLHYASVFNTPINRRLQTMAIAILIFLFLAGAQVTKDDHAVHRPMNSGSYFIFR